MMGIHPTPGGEGLPLARRRAVRTVRRPRAPHERDLARLTRENALLRLASAGASPRRLAAALIRVVETILPGCPCEVLVADREAGFVEVVGTRGFRSERGLGCRIPLGVGVTGAAARLGRAIWVADVRGDRRYIPGVAGACWELALPLRSGRAVVGVVDLESPAPGRPRPGVRRHLERLAAALGPAFARAAAGERRGPVRLAVLAGRGAPARGGSAAAPSRAPASAALLADDQLRAVYQPVAQLTGHAVIGYEAEVSGGPDGPWASAARLFAAHRDPAEGAGLDLARLRAALAHWRPAAGRLFLDVHAESLRRPGFAAAVAALLRERGLAPGDLVLELAVADQVEGLRQALAAAAGGAAAGGPRFALAVDRFGTGAASAEALIDLRPAFVKLDPVLVRGVDRDFGRRTYIESLCYYTRRAETQLVAVGVDTPAELSALRHAGVPYGQGELLGPAAPLRA